MQQTISDYENGGAWPSPQYLIRLAKVLQVTTDEMLGVKDVKVPRLSTSTARLWTRFKKLRSLKPSDQAVLWNIIETFFAGQERASAAKGANGAEDPSDS